MQLDESIVQIFVAEAQELLTQMEDALLRLEHEPDDVELLNGLFRAAHTIKGSAGIFGLDFIVELTHEAESVLDRVRSGELPLDPELSALLLQVQDQLKALVDCVGAHELPQAALLAHNQTLRQHLHPYLAAASLPEPVTPPQAERMAQNETDDAVQSDLWHLSLRFGPDTFRNGMDPLSFVRYLNTLGDIRSLVTLSDAVPALSDLDPESCHLGFEIGYQSAASKAQIEDCFEFVRDDCRLRILPPRSRIGDFVQLIRELPEEDMKLGEILVKCGALSEHELRAVLADQQRHDGDHHKPIGELLIEQVVVQPPVVEAALEKQQKVKEQKRQESSFVRVEAQKLDYLINLVGELVIAGAGTNLRARDLRDGQLIQSTNLVMRLVENVRDSALQLRMIPIGNTFNRFQRVVRDVSAELGKEIALEISGGETEVDKSLVKKIADPLTHLVRNSMDHGIETAEVRRAAGKPERGTVRLNAHHNGGTIVIEVVDDGGGLRRDRIVAKAIERGLIQSGEGMSDRDVFDLIFQPGFSTADQVTNLSGRGVGMDVVKRNIADLRGTIEIDSMEGVGTTMRIRLPLTLAIIDGFLVACGSSAFVIPLEQVFECLSFDASQDRSRDYMDLRGEVLPLISLREAFAIADPMMGKRGSVVVVEHSGGGKAGIIVDVLMGEFQTVIKPLGPMFSHLQGISGSTILGSGQVALILDIPRLVERHIRHDRHHHQPTLVLPA